MADDHTEPTELASVVASAQVVDGEVLRSMTASCSPSAARVVATSSRTGGPCPGAQEVDANAPATSSPDSISGNENVRIGFFTFMFASRENCVARLVRQ